MCLSQVGPPYVWTLSDWCTTCNLVWLKELQYHVILVHPEYGEDAGFGLLLEHTPAPSASRAVNSCILRVKSPCVVLDSQA